MLVCVCRVVSDTTVREAVAAGARTVEEVGRACGAGMGCGNCRRSLEAIVAEGRESEHPPLVPCKKAA